MRKQLFLLTLILIPLLSKGQEATSVFNFLKIPMSAHVAALGGDNVSLKLDDPTLVFSNPAQAAAVNDNSLNLDYQTYVADTKILGAAFVKVFSVRHTVAVTGQVFNYGSMDETDEDGNVLGSFSAKDMAFSALYSYTMGNHWVGGATGRFITSKYADYSSTAVSVDLGLHYDNEENGLSFGVALKNIGAQLSSFHEDHKEHLPFDMQVGVSQKMAHAPSASRSLSRTSRAGATTTISTPRARAVSVASLPTILSLVSTSCLLTRSTWPPAIISAVPTSSRPPAAATAPDFPSVPASRPTRLRPAWHTPSITWMPAPCSSMFRIAFRLKISK